MPNVEDPIRRSTATSYTVPSAGSIDGGVSDLAGQNAAETGSVAVPDTIPPVTQNTYVDQSQMVNYVTPQVMATPYVQTADVNTVPPVEATTAPQVEATMPTLDPNIPVVNPDDIMNAVQSVVLESPIAQMPTQNAQPAQQPQQLTPAQQAVAAAIPGYNIVPPQQ